MEVNQQIIDLLVGTKYGAKPFTPGQDIPQDVGLGGPSTEYLAGAPDQAGIEMNYPQIWWLGGEPVLLDQGAAYDKALSYEAGSGLRFPRYQDWQSAEFAAQNRSALGGASSAPLASLFGLRNF